MSTDAGPSIAPVAGPGDVFERFPFTKFLPPLLDERVVAEGIVAHLTWAVEAHPVAVVVAPAGAGKTTAMAAWARTVDAPVAWLRLGPQDDSPMMIAAALASSIRRVIDGFGPRIAHVLSIPATSTGVPQLLTALVNDLGALSGPSPTLVLDDLHEVVDPPTLAFLDELLDLLPPGVRTLIGTRSEPPLSLARRRVRGHLAELGFEQLRLDAASVRRILRQDGDVDDAFVDAVIAASDGWAAAVRLATARIAAGAVSLGARDDEPLIDLWRSDLWRTLAEVVLDEQPAELRRFLVETSILDELTPAVCEAVTGRRDAARLLRDVERRHLFLDRHVADGAEAWRYHGLFAAFLREQLLTDHSDDARTALHRRAAAALAPAAAVPHLLAVGDHDRVAEIAIQVGYGSMDGSITAVVIPWLEALPSAVVDRDHRLSVMLAFRDEVLGRSAAVRSRLEPVYVRLHAAGEDRAASEVALELATADLMEGDLSRIGRFLDEAPEGMPAWQHIGFLVVRMHWCRARGDWAGVTVAMEDAFAFAREVDDARVARILASGLSCELLFNDRGPQWAAIRSDELLGTLTHTDLASLTSLRRLIAAAAWLRLDLVRAADETQRCLAGSRELGGMAWVQQEAELLTLQLALGRRDHATVGRILDDVAARRGRSPVDVVFGPVYAIAGLRADRLRGERRGPAIPPVELGAAGGMPDEPARMIADALAEAFTARAAGRGAEALDVLEAAERVQHEGRRWFARGLPGLERADILFDQGRVSAAIEAAEPTLAVAARYGAGILWVDAPSYRRLLERCARAGVHAEVVRAALAVTDRAAASARTIPGTDESVSPRELEVLIQVALGRSNREIGETLFISEVTVKSHLTRILRKLSANSRTHAVARARELHLL